MFWRLAVLDGWRKPFVHTLSYSIFFVCMNVLHRAYFISSYTYALYVALSLNDKCVIYMCLGGVSLEVSFLFICNNSMCFASLKRGRFLAQRSFTLVLMITKHMKLCFLIISFKQVSGFLVVAFGFLDKTHIVLEP